MKQLIPLIAIVTVFILSGCSGGGSSKVSLKAPKMKKWCTLESGQQATSKKIAKLCCEKEKVKRKKKKGKKKVWVAISPPPEGCPRKPGAARGEPLRRGASSVKIARQSLAAAESLISPAEVAETGSTLASAAAKAGGPLQEEFQDLGDSDQADSSSSGQFSEGSLPGNNSPKSGGSAGVGSLLKKGSQLLGFNLDDAPSANPKKDQDPDAKAATAESNLAYSGGRGRSGARYSKGKKEFGSLLSRKNGALQGQSPSEMQFGVADREPASMGDEDPEDYFGRINIHTSLFKVVEKRYREKSLQWSSSRAF